MKKREKNEKEGEGGGSTRRGNNEADDIGAMTSNSRRLEREVAKVGRTMRS